MQGFTAVFGLFIHGAHGGTLGFQGPEYFDTFKD